MDKYASETMHSPMSELRRYVAADNEMPTLVNMAT